MMFPGHRNAYADRANLGDGIESPRVLIRNGRVAEASNVVDMLSLEEDAATRAEETVRIILG